MTGSRLTIALLFILMLSIVNFSCGGGGGTGGGIGAIQSSVNNSHPEETIPDTIGVVNLAWDPPLTNADGTPLTDLAGYRVYYGTAPRSIQGYNYSVDIGNITGAVISSLSKGDWYFAVTAYDTSGNESIFSNEVKKSI